MKPIGLILAVVVLAGAQLLSEQFIPIGRSPGISGKLSAIGTIEAIDAEARTVTIETSGGDVIAEIVAETSIWLDRSESNQTAVTGSFDDLAEGREVEALSTDHERMGAGPLEWIKVRP